MILRSYQDIGVQNTLASINRGARPVFVLPTGGGKTACAVELIKQFQAARPGARVIFNAHRKELITQAAKHLGNAGLSVGIIKAGFPYYASRTVQVASVQTLARRDKPAADMLIFDEVHHVLAKTYRDIVAAYPMAVIVGITATPWHRGGVGLGDVFDEIVVGARASELIDAGFLVEPVVYAPPPAMLNGVKSRFGDYVTSELAKAVDKPKLVGDVVATWERLAGDRTTLAFGVNVEHSQHMAAAFNARGIKFRHVDGDTDEHERDDAVAALAAGDIKGISNCGLFTEGFDLPAIKCLVLNRPTRSYALFLQMIGRVMRPTPGGETAVVLDHGGCTVLFGGPRRHIEYSLESGPSASEPLGLKTCPKCFLMLPTYAKVCQCGHDFTAARSDRALPENVDGVLVPYEDPEGSKQAPPPPTFTWEDKERFFRETYELAAERNWKPGAVQYRFKEKFGHWPVIVMIDGVGRLATPESDDATKAAAFEKFAKEAAEKGYKPGYAKARYHETFKRWPTAAMVNKARAAIGAATPLFQGAA